jgi:hypothetical protein
MKRQDKKLIFVFVTLLIINLATIAGITYYYETKEESGFGAAGEDVFAKTFVDKSVGTAPLSVNFSSLVFNTDGGATYHWDFGDGNTSNETSPAYNYTAEGNYTCTLTITDESGENVTTSVDIIVLANAPPTVVALVTPFESNRPYIPLLDEITAIPPIGEMILIAMAKAGVSPGEGWINCEAQAYDPEGDEIVEYEWELTQPPFRLIGETQYHKFYFYGKNLTIPLIYTYRWRQYSIKLTVTDSSGNKASDIKTFGISASNWALTKNDIRKSWNNFWDINFYSLSTEVQTRITKAVWRVLGPIQGSLNDVVDKILEPLPDGVSMAIEDIYDMLWEQQEKKYRKPNTRPNTPSNPGPTDGAVGINPYTNLNWTCTDPDDHPLRYDIYFGTTQTPPLVVSDYTNKTLTFDLGPKPLDNTTTYYWKIVARDEAPTGDSKTATSPIWTFTTA